jgi:hypothetical protein
VLPSRKGVKEWLAGGRAMDGVGTSSPARICSLVVSSSLQATTYMMDDRSATEPCHATQSAPFHFFGLCRLAPSRIFSSVCLLLPPSSTHSTMHGMTESISAHLTGCAQDWLGAGRMIMDHFIPLFSCFIFHQFGPCILSSPLILRERCI